MKKLFLCLLACTMLLSCSKDENNNDNSGNSLSNTPIAKAAYDSKNYGVYKGVFVGSTGSVLINMKNDGTTISATLVIDGISYVFTSEDHVTEGTNTTITFHHNDDYFDFTVVSDGSNPTISNIHISGHVNAAIYVDKEESDAQVYCYQGTFTEEGGGGTWNLFICDGKVTGLVLPNDYQVLPHFEGLITNNTITASIQEIGLTITGTVNGNNITGNWFNTAESKTGTWEATRKL